MRSLQVFQKSACSQRLRWHRVSIVHHHADTRFSRIVSRKRKSSQNSFCLFIWGPGGVFFIEECRKSRDTVPLNEYLLKLKLFLFFFFQYTAKEISSNWTCILKVGVGPNGPQQYLLGLNVHCTSFLFLNCLLSFRLWDCISFFKIKIYRSLQTFTNW